MGTSFIFVDEESFICITLLKGIEAKASRTVTDVKADWMGFVPTTQKLLNNSETFVDERFIGQRGMVN